jgi:hypothetical protein
MGQKPRSYGWSPEQMARINARREARGADLYIDEDMGDGDYMERYESESGKYGAKATQRKPAFPSKRPSTLDAYNGQKSPRDKMAERGSMKDEAKARTEEFRKKFKPEGSMGIEKSVGSEAEKLKRNRGMGISTPSYLQGSYNRIGATA